MSKGGWRSGWHLPAMLVAEVLQEVASLGTVTRG